MAVALSSGVEGARIAYTLNGGPPVAGSEIYAQPFTLRRGTTLRARAFKPGMRASEEVVSTPGQARIQFQPKGAATPAGCLVDCGEEFGPRVANLSYGWSADCTKQTRARGTGFCYFIEGQQWEFALPNGRYQITVGLSNDLQNEATVNVEGVNFCRALKLRDSARQLTGTVEVKDGRLTIDSGDAKDMMTKISEVVIKPAHGAD